MGSIVASCLSGVVAGFLGGSAVGIAVGMIVGACIGTLAYKAIDNHNFDIHFNRVFWAGFCIAGSIVAGGIGGYIGAKLHGLTTNTNAQAAANHESMLSGAQFLEDGRVLDSKGNYIGVHVTMQQFNTQQVGFLDGYILIRTIPAL